MEYYEIIGWIGAALTSLCFLPMTIKVIVTRKTKDLSLTMLIVLVLANIIWIVYGFTVPNQIPPIYVANIIQLLLALIITILKIIEVHKELKEKKDKRFKLKEEEKERKIQLKEEKKEAKLNSKKE